MIFLETLCVHGLITAARWMLMPNDDATTLTSEGLHDTV